LGQLGYDRAVGAALPITSRPARRARLRVAPRAGRLVDLGPELIASCVTGRQLGPARIEPATIYTKLAAREADRRIGRSAALARVYANDP
jgi:hypothetical protein